MCWLWSRSCWVGKWDFPQVKPEAVEPQAADSAGFVPMVGWGPSNSSSAIEECEAVLLGQGIPFHTRAKRKKKATRVGKGWVELECSRTGCRVPVTYFQLLQTPDTLSILEVKKSLINKLPANATTAWCTCSVIVDIVFGAHPCQSHTWLIISHPNTQTQTAKMWSVRSNQNSRNRSWIRLRIELHLQYM